MRKTRLISHLPGYFNSFYRRNHGFKCNSKSILVNNFGVLLREFIESDANLLFKTVEANRKYLREWLPWVDSCISVEDSRKFIEISARQNQESTALVLGIFHASKLLGTTSFVIINRQEKNAELGYWITQQEQGKGLVTASCLALMDHGFNNFKLDEIYVRCVKENLRSVNVIKRLGFQLTCIQEEQYKRGVTQVMGVVKGQFTRKNWNLLHGNGFSTIQLPTKS